jgi:hypothetical protein
MPFHTAGSWNSVPNIKSILEPVEVLRWAVPVTAFDKVLAFGSRLFRRTIHENKTFLDAQKK